MSDRAIAKLPAATRRLWHTVVDQPAGSRLRRWLLTRVFTSGWAATNEKDWDYLEAFYDTEVVVIAGEGMPFDFGTTHGWGELRTGLDRSFDAFLGDQNPIEAIDFGGPFVGVRVDATFTGDTTGIAVTSEMTYVYELGDEGRAVRQWCSSNPDEIEAWLSELSDPEQQPAGGSPPRQPRSR